MDTNDTGGTMSGISDEAAPPSPAPLPDEDPATASLVASSTALGTDPLSGVLQDLYERAGGYAIAPAAPAPCTPTAPPGALGKLGAQASAARFLPGEPRLLAM